MPKKERRSTAQRQSVKLRMKDRPTPDSSRVSSVSSSLRNSPRRSLTPTEMSRISKADETLPKEHEELLDRAEELRTRVKELEEENVKLQERLTKVAEKEDQIKFFDD